MPFMIRKEPCKKCEKPGKLTRNRWNRINKKWYLQTTCKDCEAVSTKTHQQQNRDKWREYNRKSYLNRSDEQKLKKALRSSLRHKRLRHTSWEKEFTEFVYSEAHELRILRNNNLLIEHHVDHIIPLNGINVSGLHVWNNFAVIPKVDNLRKGNYHSIHD